ncbi:MAG TPA: SRPBCC family protein [Acidimicrobiia bacterium]|jgi:uncharacterized protein YndB with AHSA1/START domain
MPEFTTSVVIERPVQEVWDFLNDIRNRDKWNKEVVGTTYDGVLREGATGTDTMAMGGRQIRMDWRVTRFEPPHRLEMAYGPPTNAVADFTFEEMGGGTRLSCHTILRPSGWMRFLSPFLAGEGRKADEVQFAKVKAFLEGGGQG